MHASTAAHPWLRVVHPATMLRVQIVGGRPPWDYSTASGYGVVC